MAIIEFIAQLILIPVAYLILGADGFIGVAAGCAFSVAAHFAVKRIPRTALRLLTLAAMVAMFLALGWRGWLGFSAACTLFQFGHLRRHGRFCD